MRAFTTNIFYAASRIIKIIIRPKLMCTFFPKTLYFHIKFVVSLFKVLRLCRRHDVDSIAKVLWMHDWPMMQAWLWKFEVTGRSILVGMLTFFKCFLGQARCFFFSIKNYLRNKGLMMCEFFLHFAGTKNDLAVLFLRPLSVSCLESRITHLYRQ